MRSRKCSRNTTKPRWRTGSRIICRRRLRFGRTRRVEGEGCVASTRRAGDIYAEVRHFRADFWPRERGTPTRYRLRRDLCRLLGAVWLRRISLSSNGNRFPTPRLGSSEADRLLHFAQHVFEFGDLERLEK